MDQCSGLALSGTGPVGPGCWVLGGTPVVIRPLEAVSTVLGMSVGGLGLVAAVSRMWGCLFFVWGQEEPCAVPSPVCVQE